MIRSHNICQQPRNHHRTHLCGTHRLDNMHRQRCSHIHWAEIVWWSEGNTAKISTVSNEVKAVAQSMKRSADAFLSLVELFCLFCWVPGAYTISNAVFPTNTMFYFETKCIVNGEVGRLFCTFTDSTAKARLIAYPRKNVFISRCRFAKERWDCSTLNMVSMSASHSNRTGVTWLGLVPYYCLSTTFSWMNCTNKRTITC